MTVVWHLTCVIIKDLTRNHTVKRKCYKPVACCQQFIDHYCSHVPKAKATTMAETPELKRIAENTKLQSNVKYHADFEKAKGKFTQVADDPEMLRIKQNTKIIR